MSKSTFGELVIVHDSKSIRTIASNHTWLERLRKSNLNLCPRGQKHHQHIIHALRSLDKQVENLQHLLLLTESKEQ
jgi:hypothetical protein